MSCRASRAACVALALLLLHAPSHTPARTLTNNSTHTLAHHALHVHTRAALAALRWLRLEHRAHQTPGQVNFHVYENELFNISTIFTPASATVRPADFLMFVDSLAPGPLHRYKRETHSLIGTFDISKMFKKRKYKSKPTEELQPSASSLQGGRQASFTNDVNTERQIQSVSQQVTPPRTLEVRSEATPGTSSSTERMVTELEMNTFTIPARILPTESDHIMTTKTLEVTVKPDSKGKPRKLKNTSKTSTAAPSDNRREARVIPKKKNSENETVWPVKHAAVVEGDIILGGLMMVNLPWTLKIKVDNLKNVRVSMS